MKTAGRKPFWVRIPRPPLRMQGPGQSPGRFSFCRNAHVARECLGAEPAGCGGGAGERRRRAPVPGGGGGSGGSNRDRLRRPGRRRSTGRGPGAACGRATTGATVGESGLRMRPLPSRGRSSSALVRGPRIGYISQTSRPSGIPSVSGSAGAAVLLAGGHCQCLSPSSSRSGGAAASGVALQGRTRPARRRLASGPRRRARSVMVHHALQRDQRSWPRLGDGHTAAALP